MEYSIRDGLRGLRKFLGAENSSICDCYCKISIKGIGEKDFLFEDKNSRHNQRFKDAKRQLENTNDMMKKKNRHLGSLVKNSF